jgi:hypothetical protein
MFRKLCTKSQRVNNRAAESESEGILGGVGVGKKCTDSDSDLDIKC